MAINAVIAACPFRSVFPSRLPAGPGVELFLHHGVICGIVVHMNFVISV